MYCTDMGWTSKYPDYFRALMNTCTLVYVYFLLQMPTLKPEDMSMVGLNLFTQLCSLARVANASLEKPLSEDQVGTSSNLAKQLIQCGYSEYYYLLPV